MGGVVVVERVGGSVIRKIADCACMLSLFIRQSSS